MKDHFDRNRHRLDDAEKAELWQKISLADPGKRVSRRTWLAPTMGVAAVAVCGFIFLYVSMSQETGPVGYRGSPPTFSRAPQDQADAKGRKVEKESEILTTPAPEPGRPAEIGVTAEPKGKSTSRAQNDAVAGTGAEAGKDSDGNEVTWGEIKKLDDPTAVALGALDEGDAVTLPEEDEQSTTAVTPEAKRQETESLGSESFAVDAVEESLSDQAEVRMRAGELQVRGGRSGTVEFSIDAPVDVEMPPPAVRASESSIFSITADKASYIAARDSLSRGRLPSAGLIRVEDFVNAIDPGYPAVQDTGIVIHADGAPSPFRPGWILLRIVVQSRPDSSARIGSQAPTVTLSQLRDRNAFVQVDFDAAQVKRFRLLGYTGHTLAATDPAGSDTRIRAHQGLAQPLTPKHEVADREVALDQDPAMAQVAVALYEIELAPTLSDSLVRAESGRTPAVASPAGLAMVKILNELPGTEGGRVPVSAQQDVSAIALAPKFQAASPQLQLAAIMAEFAQVLQGRSAAPGSRLSELERLLGELAPALPGDESVTELANAIRQAKVLLCPDPPPEE